MDVGISGLRIPGILGVILIVLASGISPGMASDILVGENTGSTGNPASMILGMWEQDGSPSLENGDTGHSLSGSQFLPSCTSENTREIQIFVVTPAGTENPGPASVQAVVENAKDSFHQQVPLTPLTYTEGIFFAGNAGTADLIRYTGTATADEIVARLREGTARVWKGTIGIPSWQHAGEYIVYIQERHQDGDNTLLEKNSFSYLPVACMEFDFSGIDYGTSRINQETWIRGDDSFGTSDKPSMRNTGNSPAQLKFTQDDMGFGKNSDSAWNIQYGIRSGDNVSISTYSPGKEVILSDPVMPGAVEPLDFSLRVYEGSGNHHGTMTMGFEKIEVTDPDGSLPGDEEMPVPEFPHIPGIREMIAGFVNSMDDQTVVSAWEGRAS